MYDPEEMPSITVLEVDGISSPFHILLKDVKISLEPSAQKIQVKFPVKVDF
ncbi:hypothetical protein DOT_1253 [Desulfosporosinus sp. OT]|nr:hypothetical protein DOT_1253 [Desulfosporosinus sp. OT]